MLEKIIPASGLKVDYSGGPSEGSSDHTSFTAHQVPALFFFSGLHSDYHKPSDTWDKIDAPAAHSSLASESRRATAPSASTSRPESISSSTANLGRSIPNCTISARSRSSPNRFA